MYMRNLLIFMTLFICTGALVFAQADRNTRYVTVQNVALKSSTGFFASTLRSLSFGDAVTLVSESGKWSQVRIGTQTGWVASNNLSTRQVVAANSSGFSSNEVALAGKGFSPEMEMEYKRSGLDFTLVDEMERTNVPTDDLLRFINEGRLSRGE